MADQLIDISVQSTATTNDTNEHAGVPNSHGVPNLVRYWTSKLGKPLDRGKSGLANYPQKQDEPLEGGTHDGCDNLLDEYFLLILESGYNPSEGTHFQENNKNPSSTTEVESIVEYVPSSKWIDDQRYAVSQHWPSSNIDRIASIKRTPSNNILLTTSSSDIPSVLDRRKKKRSRKLARSRQETHHRRQLIHLNHIKYNTYPLSSVGSMEVHQRRSSDDESIGSEEDAAILRAYQRRTSSVVPQQTDGNDCQQEVPPAPAILVTEAPDSSPEPDVGENNKWDGGGLLPRSGSRGLASSSSLPPRRHSVASTDAEHLEDILSFLNSRPGGLPEIGELVLVPDEEEEEILTLNTTKNSTFKTQYGLNSLDNQVAERTKPSVPKRPERRNLVRKQHRQGRRSSIDVASLSKLENLPEDPHFAREILHQKIISMASSHNRINEDNEEESEKDNGISVQRTRRLSINSMLQLPKQLTGGRCDLSDESNALNGSSVSIGDRLEVPSKTIQRDARRSSWACTSMFDRDRRGSRATLLSLSIHQGDQNSENKPEMMDPYRLTLHFISDPKQSKKLRSLLRPLTQPVVPKLRLFHFVDRSEPMVIENKEPDVMTIPSLAIMVFLQEEKGIERILEAREYLKEDPRWQIHHKDLVGGGVVPYPTNNQDFYSHAEGMPLWAVRQILGKDRLRFMVFASHDNWGDMMSFYSNVLDRDVQFKKDDFCYFAVFSCQKMSLEVQLALKRLPPDFVPTPLDAAILQFKVDDIDKLMPLLLSECSAISDVRRQTTDPDGNKVLLLLPPRSVETGQTSVKTDENGNQRNTRDRTWSDPDIPNDYV